MKPKLVLLVAVAIPYSARGQALFPSAPSGILRSRVPPDCNRPSLLANGYPIMASLRDGLTIGVSLAQREFKSGEPIQLHIWVDNTSNTAVGVFTCMDLDRFKRVGFEVFGQNGRRILSRSELGDRKECSTNPKSVSHWGGPVACARNIMFSIPAHTCVAHDNYDFTAELTSQYELPPAKYVVRLRTNWTNGIDLCKLESKAGFHPSLNDLRFTVMSNPD